MRNARIRSILNPSPNRLLRCKDLVYEYGMTEDAGYEVLHRHGVKLAGGYYIKRSVLDKVLEGNGKLF